MPINDEYAARTACRDHTLINAKPQYGSLRLSFLSQCELARWNFGCKYSHTIFNVDRVYKLGGHDGRTSFVISLDYGHGFECYGSYENWASGWDVRIPDPPKANARIGPASARNLPKALLAAEARAGLKKAGDAVTTYAKVQSICRAHDERNACRRRGCKFDHDLVDSKRIEKLVRWPPHPQNNYDALTVECHAVEGRMTWKIILKEPVFDGLKATDPIAQRIPSRPYSYESANLLDVVRHMEELLGISGSQ